MMKIRGEDFDVYRIDYVIYGDVDGEEITKEQYDLLVERIDDCFDGDDEVAFWFANGEIRVNGSDVSEYSLDKLLMLVDALGLEVDGTEGIVDGYAQDAQERARGEHEDREYDSWVEDMLAV